jgi:hypothetical protein
MVISSMKSQSHEQQKVNSFQRKVKAMKKPIIPVYQESEEEEIDIFTYCVDAFVKDGIITRETLDEVKDHLRPIAEAELKKQGK